MRDQIGSWKAGKFLALTSRPWSINSYCLSKLWYRTACIDLRAGDSDAITSNIKGWLYQDLLEKPQEMMIYRQPDQGGLGVHHVRCRAMAMLVHTFLSQAICPKFMTNHYYTALYQWHVLDRRDMADPGRPPYYSADFFSTIRDVHQNTPLNLAWVTLRQWYQILIERGITHTSNDLDSPPQLILNRSEERNQQVEFSTPYRLARQFGLSPDQKSFLFKLIQSILPTRDRLARMRKADSAQCMFCDQLDSTCHIILCSNSSEVTMPLMNCLSTHLDNITPENIVMMNVKPPESMELPLTWLVATCLGYVWEMRADGKKAKLMDCKAILLAKVAMLKQTHWKKYTLHNGAVLLEEMINLHYNLKIVEIK